jgi:hypothetical protein
VVNFHRIRSKSYNRPFQTLLQTGEFTTKLSIILKHHIMPTMFVILLFATAFGMDDCMICYGYDGNLPRRERTVLKNCNHNEFCFHCIEKYIGEYKHTKCPYCKQNIVKVNDIPLRVFQMSRLNWIGKIRYTIESLFFTVLHMTGKKKKKVHHVVLFIVNLLILNPLQKFADLIKPYLMVLFWISSVMYVLYVLNPLQKFADVIKSFLLVVKINWKPILSISFLLVSYVFGSMFLQYFIANGILVAPDVFDELNHATVLEGNKYLQHVGNFQNQISTNYGFLGSIAGVVISNLSQFCRNYPSLKCNKLIWPTKEANNIKTSLGTVLAFLQNFDATSKLDYAIMSENFYDFHSAWFEKIKSNSQFVDVIANKMVELYTRSLPNERFFINIFYACKSYPSWKCYRIIANHGPSPGLLILVKNLNT